MSLTVEEGKAAVIGVFALFAYLAATATRALLKRIRKREET